jgi:hypothetical protein
MLDSNPPQCFALQRLAPYFQFYHLAVYKKDNSRREKKENVVAQ